MSLRALKPDDLEKVVELDAKNSGRKRRVFYEKRLAAALARPDDFVAMASESDGALSGFAFARIQNGEFGEAERVATLDIIDVDPGEQGHGHGRALVSGLMDVLKKKNVAELRTQVDWSDRDITSFFAASGFELAPVQVLEVNVADVSD